MDENLDWFFDNVFEKTTYIDYRVTDIRNKFVLSNDGNFTCPVEVAYYDMYDEELEREWIRGIKHETILKPPLGTIKVKIDPDEHMPDINRSNNGTSKNYEFNFIWDKPNYFNHVYNIVPWFFSYNYYNGFTPGITMFSGFSPGYVGNGNTLSFLYDFKNKKPIGSISFTRLLRDINIFHESVFKLRFDRSSGRTGINVSLSGVFKEPFLDSPISNLNANFFYHMLESSAFNPILYDSGKFIIGAIDYNKKWELNNQSSLDFGTGIKFSKEFSRIFFTVSTNYSFAKKIKTKVKFYLSDYLLNKNLPSQYKTFLSGSIDPDFQENILDRTGKSANFKVLTDFLYDGGPGLRGLILNENGNPMYTEKLAWSLRIDQEFPYLPGVLFMDFGGLSEYEDVFISLGFHLGPLIIPVYQSWEISNNTPDDMGWILDRLRISLDFTLPRGFIF